MLRRYDSNHGNPTAFAQTLPQAEEFSIGQLPECLMARFLSLSKFFQMMIRLDFDRADVQLPSGQRHKGAPDRRPFLSLKSKLGVMLAAFAKPHEQHQARPLPRLLRLPNVGVPV